MFPCTTPFSTSSIYSINSCHYCLFTNSETTHFQTLLRNMPRYSKPSCPLPDEKQHAFVPCLRDDRHKTFYTSKILSILLLIHLCCLRSDQPPAHHDAGAVSPHLLPSMQCPKAKEPQYTLVMYCPSRCDKSHSSCAK